MDMQIIMDTIWRQVQEQIFEVLFIDDGSTDNTYQLCRQYAKHYPYINVVHVDNQGVSHARNIGIEAAKGEWIQFIDVDDLIHQNMFLTFYENLVQLGGDLAVCGCVRRNIETKEDTLCGPEKNTLVCGRDIIQLFKGMKMEQRYWMLDYIWNKWYKREVIEHYHIRFPEKLSLGEDFVFNTQYFQHISSFAMLSECEIRRQYGQIFWGDIRRINNSDCHFTIKQKLAFIKKMVKSQMFDMIFDYLNVKRKKKFRIYRAIMKTKNVPIIYCAIRLEKLLSHYITS